jgi:hypothetical protein
MATTAYPKLLIPRVGTDGVAVWAYTSTDVHTDVDAADYFTNGDAAGLKVGDIMLVSKSSATKGTTIHYVGTVTAGGAASIEPAILA